ncbi:kinase-like domain-containing protein [Pisolithus croceorrhizus]|nr:kinase-like domain-containing protein [Pisolithus croceorrhizus]KAI6148241.1 kinase-like domain-containing protein [Pisolithus thermaeus]
MDSPLQVLSRHAARYSVNLDGQVVCDTSYHPLCGGSADVYRGTMQPARAEVAIKIIRSDLASDITAIKRTLREVHIWSKLQHENILPLLGVTTDFDCTVSIVSPWMKSGNAFTYVQDKTVDPRPLLMGIIRGLCYLHTHNPPIFHGDLKGFNVLISSEGRALLSDFGLSTLVASSFSMSMSRPTGGSVRWMAPEVISSFANAGSKGDVWAFGMTALELFTRDVPFNSITSLPAVMLQVLEGPPDRPSLKSTCFRMTGDWWELCLSCWKRDPSARPQTSEILSRIQTWQERTSSSSADELKFSTSDIHPTSSNSSMLGTKGPGSVLDESATTIPMVSSGVHFPEPTSSDDKTAGADTSGSFSTFLASITGGQSASPRSSNTIYNQNHLPNHSAWIDSVTSENKNSPNVLPTKDADLVGYAAIG